MGTGRARLGVQTDTVYVKAAREGRESASQDNLPPPRRPEEDGGHWVKAQVPFLPGTVHVH